MTSDLVNMWDNQRSKSTKGLMQILEESAGALVEFNPQKYTFEQMAKDFDAICEHDRKRREFMDKEYTPLSEITCKEIENAARPYSDNIPIGLLVKVRISGQYMDIPLRGLVAMNNKAKEMFENQNKA